MPAKSNVDIIKIDRAQDKRTELRLDSQLSRQHLGHYAELTKAARTIQSSHIEKDQAKSRKATQSIPSSDGVFSG